MPEVYTAYCIKDKAKMEILDPVDAEFKNGTPIKKGRCAGCGGTLQAIQKRTK